MTAMTPPWPPPARRAALCVNSVRSTAASRVLVKSCFQLRSRSAGRSQTWANAAEVYCDPRSAWKITPVTLPPRVATAAWSASMTSSARMRGAIDQPSTRRDRISMTQAR